MSAYIEIGDCSYTDLWRRGEFITFRIGIFADLQLLHPPYMQTNCESAESQAVSNLDDKLKMSIGKLRPAGVQTNAAQKSVNLPYRFAASHEPAVGLRVSGLGHHE